MSIRVALHHATHYTYDRPIGLGPQVIRLRPAPHCRTPIVSYRLDVQPADHFLNWQQDPQANWLARVLVPEPTDHARRDRRSGRGHGRHQPVRLLPRSVGRTVSVRLRSETLALELAPYLVAEPLGDAFESYLASIDRTPRPTTSFVFDLNAALQRDIGYVIRMEPGVQTPDETLANALGLVSRLGVAAGQSAAPARTRGAIRLRLSHSTQSRRHVARRTVGSHGGFHRPARVVRSLSAGRRLGRARSDVGAVCGRRPHPAGLRGEPRLGLADFRHGRSVRGDVRLRDVGHARARTAARYQAVHARAMGGDRSARRPRRRRRCATATCASRWAASRRSLRSTTWMPRSGRPLRSDRRSARSATR